MDINLSDTLPSAKYPDLSGVDGGSPGTTRSARSGGVESAAPAPNRAPYTLLDGVKLLSGALTVARGIGPVVTLLRLAGLRNPLSWIGLARRRGPLATLSLFGAGLAAGAGAGLLFAPRSGSDLRRSLVDGWVSGEAPSFAGSPGKRGPAARPTGERIAPWVSASTVSIEDAPRPVVDVNAATTRDTSVARAKPAVAPPDQEHAVIDSEAARPTRAGGAAPGHRFG